jgi:hypothetical protein
MSFRESLINSLNGFCLNSPSDGYDWGELFDKPFAELSEEELIELNIHYLNYLKGE